MRQDSADKSKTGKQPATGKSAKQVVKRRKPAQKTGAYIAGANTKIVSAAPAMVPAFDSFSDYIKLLSGYKPLFKTPGKKLETIKKGLQPHAIEDLLQVTGATKASLAHLLSLTEPTLRKYIRAKEDLNVTLSEHVLLLFELFDKGIETLGSLEEFKTWLQRPSVGLNAMPMDLLDTVTGINIVMSELLRIDYGILA